MKKNRALYLCGKQIRCWINKNTYDELKNEAKKLGMSLQSYAGLRLNGFRIVKIQENPEKLG